MIQNQEQNWENMTIKSLEARLRSLPDIDIPEGLCTKLLTSIPSKNEGLGVAPKRQFCWHRRFWRVGITVAAVIVLALVLVSVYEPASVPENTVTSQRFMAGLNDVCCCARTDQNNASFEDINQANRFQPINIKIR